MTRNHVIALQFCLQGGKKDSIRGNHPKNLMHHGNKVSSHWLQKLIGSCAHKTVQNSKTPTETRMMYCRKMAYIGNLRVQCVLALFWLWSCVGVCMPVYICKWLFSLPLLSSRWAGHVSRLACLFVASVICIA